MNEILGMAYGFARAAWKRRWLAVATAWSIALIAWLFVLTIPDQYEASARAFVDARTALRPVLEGIAIKTDYDSQLSLVREQLLSRPQLQAVARETLPAEKAQLPGQVEAEVSALQNQIKISSFNPTSADGGTQNTLYTIAYRNTDRDRSVLVVKTLLEKFQQGTLSGNKNGANETQQFLNQQIGELEVRMRAAEARVADFKKRNIGQIPGEKGDYFSRYEVETSGLQKSETDLAVSYGQRAELQKQLANARAFLPGTSSSAGTAGGTPDITQRRMDAEQRYEELLLRFTDKHPEAIALRETIADLKQREEKELLDLQRGGAGTGAIRSMASNPVYQQIQSQLNGIQVQIAAQLSERDQHNREIANLRQFIDRAPEIQQEWESLNRDYGSLKAQYDQLVGRREQARVTDDAATAGIVRFEVIDPPRASENPVSPKRPLLVIAVLFLAIGAGMALAILPHLFSPTFNDVVSLQKKLGVPVLGAVSLVSSQEQRELQRWQIFRVAFATGTLVVTAAVLAIAGRAGARILHVLIT